MNKKLTRSFFGAALCTFLCIWPAATLSEPVLLIPGGIIGWLLGYHGDRILYGFTISWSRAAKWRSERKQRCCRVGLSNKLIPNLENIMTGIGVALASIVRALFCATRSVSSFIVDFVLGLLWLPKKIFNWYHEHPINKAYTVNIVLVIMFLGIISYGVWEVMVAIGPQVGDVTADMYGKTRLLPMSEVVFQRVLFTALAVMFLHLPVSIFYQSESDTLRGFYTMWERHDTMSKAGFIVNEIRRLLWVQLWWICMLPVIICIVLFAGIIGVFVFAVSTLIIMSGIRISWHIVRMNNDYGIVSLAVGLLIGLGTYYSQYQQLAVDPTYRLLISTIAGVASGALSLSLTWIGGMMFTRIKWFHKVASVEDMFDLDDPMIMFAFTYENAVPRVWNWGKRYLPANISTSI